MCYIKLCLHAYLLTFLTPTLTLTLTFTRADLVAGDVLLNMVSVYLIKLNFDSMNVGHLLCVMIHIYYI